jgi:hypothetical protein
LPAFGPWMTTPPSASWLSFMTTFGERTSHPLRQCARLNFPFSEAKAALQPHSSAAQGQLFQAPSEIVRESHLHGPNGANSGSGLDGS